MLRTTPTKNLTGITISGDFHDFYELVNSIYNITISGPEQDVQDFYYGVKMRLLGACYDIRHAFMGDRQVSLVDNGMNEDLMAWHKLEAPTKNVYYSVNILFPEAVFLAVAVPCMYVFSYRNYGSKKKDGELDISPIPYRQYIRDKANLDVLCAGIWQALSEVIGDEEMVKIYHKQELHTESFMNYATHYIDKCNVELLKTAVEKRKDKIRNIAKRIVKKPAAYFKMEEDLKYWAKQYKTNIYELHDPRMEYPEEIVW